MARSGHRAPDGLPDGEQGELFQVTAEQTFYRSGPLPDPAELAAYKRIDPQLVNRIVSMAEVSVHGRHEVLKRAVTAESFAVITGAVTMALVAIGGLAASIVLLVMGYEVTALLTAVPSILIGIGQIVTAARKKSNEDG